MVSDQVSQAGRPPLKLCKTIMHNSLEAALNPCVYIKINILNYYALINWFSRFPCTPFFYITVSMCELGYLCFVAISAAGLVAWCVKGLQ